MFLFIDRDSQYEAQAGIVLSSSCISIMNIRIIGVHTSPGFFFYILRDTTKNTEKPKLRFSLPSELNSSLYLAII